MTEAELNTVLDVRAENERAQWRVELVAGGEIATSYLIGAQRIRSKNPKCFSSTKA